MKGGIVVLLFILLVCNGARSQALIQRSDSTIIMDVDVVPQFKGGGRAWNAFLQRNLDISDLAAAMDSTTYVTYGSKQTAILEFTVCEDGQVCDVTVANSDKISPELTKEVIRVMNKSPKWIPATKNGMAVRTRFKQSIMAVLDL